MELFLLERDYPEPSTSTASLGNARSSQRGIHQLARPRSSMAEGTRTIRTKVALEMSSRNGPTALL
jgi:hypothetical protein